MLTQSSSLKDAYHTHMPIRETLSIAMTMSLLLPFLYCVVPERQETILLTLYVLGYALLPFIAILRKQAWKTSSYGAFALTVFLCLLSCLALCFLLGRLLLPEPLSLLYVAVMGGELLFVSSTASSLRRMSIRRRKAREEDDISWEERPVVFEMPRFSIFILHVLSYIWGLALHSPMQCDISLLGAFIYLPLYLSYASRYGLGLYLDEKHHVSNIPIRRISRITRVPLALVLLFLLLIMAPSLLLRGRRPYTDLREWKIELAPVETPPLGGGENMMSSLPPEILELIAASREAKELPTIFTVLFHLLVTACLLLMLRLLILAALHHVQEFRSPYDEGDLIIPLSKEEEKPEEIRKKIPKEESASDLSIRRIYKKAIRKQLKKEPPLPYEMPSDLSRRAKLLEAPEGRKLHEDYEKARYGA